MRKNSAQNMEISFILILQPSLRSEVFNINANWCSASMLIAVQLHTNTHVPLRLTIGNKEAARDTITLSCRDLPYSSKLAQPRLQFITELVQLLDTIQQGLQQKAQKFQMANIHYISNKTDFYDFFTAPNSGFALAHWNGDITIAQQIQHYLKASIRCIPLVG
jgi:prolyl-tRNA synthetase